MKTLIYFLTTVSVSIFLYFWFIPFISTRVSLWIMSRQIKRMAKKYDGKLKQDLLDISSGIKELNKQEKL